MAVHSGEVSGGRRRRMRRDWRQWASACMRRRGGGSVGRWVASRRLDGVHMMNGLDLQMEGSLVTETKTEAFEEKWMVRWAREENVWCRCCDDPFLDLNQ
ncbi:hypothetical protein ACLOJK_006430 [Asimina triloba]